MIDENYNTDRENAEEFVDFVSDIKNAAMDNNNEELQAILTKKMQQTVRSRRKFKISRILGNPFTGASMVFSGIACIIGRFLFDSTEDYFLIIGVLLLLFGILCIIWGIRNIKFTTYSMKNVYDVVNEREQKVEYAGKGKNRVEFLKDALWEGLLGGIVIILAFTRSDGIISSIIGILFGLVMLVACVANLSDFVKETKNRERNRY